MTEDQMRELLRELRDEPIPADSLARVRRGVMDRTQATGWIHVFRAPSSIAAILLAAGCLLFAILSSRKPTPVAKPAPPIVARHETVPANKPAPLVTTVRRPRRPAHSAIKAVRPLENVSATEPPVLIRIETPDPNVVILLIGDGD
jgi:hypothetical protein